LYVLNPLLTGRLFLFPIYVSEWFQRRTHTMILHMKKQHIGLLVAGVVVGIAAFFVLSGRGIGGYPYVCADGTEFRVVPAADRSSITLSAIKSAALFSEKTLPRVESNIGTMYVADGVVFFGKGEEVQFITAALSTVCHPASGGNIPLNWGQ